MLLALVRNLARFRVSLALLAAASLALTMRAPASAASPPFGAGLRPQFSHLLPARSIAQHSWTDWPGPASVHKLDGIAPSYTLYSSPARVKTTRGVIRQETIYTYKSAPTASGYIDLLLSRHVGDVSILDRSRDVAPETGGPSRHKQSLSQLAENAWVMNNLRTSEFSVHHGNATISFNSTQVGPFGRLFGTFTHTKKTQETCNVSGSEFTYTGILKVNELFKTKNRLEHHSKLGWVHGPRGGGGTIFFPNTSKTNSTFLTVDNACVNTVPATKTYCTTGTFWSSPTVAVGGGSSGLEGYKLTVHSPNPSTIDFVYGYRDLPIAGLPPSGGFAGAGVTMFRDDTAFDSAVSQSYVQDLANPFPQTESIISSSKDKYIQGSATLTSAASTTATGGACFVGNTAETEFEQEGQAPFNWTNGSRKLAADSAVGGNITIANATGSTTGEINHETSQ